MTNGVITTSLGCASMSDSNGNLLFYTDGSTVYNLNHLTMANGNGLLGNNAAQSSIILKKPGGSNLYYIFTVQGNNGTAGLNYSIVDMTLASGTGSVTVKNASLLPGSCSEKLTAAKHCNGNDFWILTYCGAFRAYSVTATGISAAVVSTTSLSVGGGGCMKLSPNGRKLATASYTTSGAFVSFDVCLFDFDNSNGIVTNGALLEHVGPSSSFNSLYAPYGCEFSPDGTKAYYSTVLGAVSQINLCAPSPSLTYNLSTSTETTNPNYSYKRTFQLGANGKIYIALPGTSSLAVVNNPNALASASNYAPQGQSLSTYTCQWGLPNFPGFYFEQKPFPFYTYASNAAVSCLTVTFSPSQVCAATGYTIIGYQWNFGDPGSGASNTSYLINPVHVYPSTGTYTAQLVRYFNCNSSDTIIQSINVTAPNLTVLSPSVSCGISSATAIVTGGIGPYSFFWSPTSLTTAVVSLTNSSGIYTISVIDNGGACAITSTAYIPNTNLNAVITLTNVNCFGDATGLATVNMSGGSGNYNYVWSLSSSTTNVITGLAVGAYSVNVSDVLNFCTIAKTFTISQPPPLTVAINNLGPTLCSGSFTTLTAMASGGSGVSNYTWTNGPSSPSYSITLNPGNPIYTVSILDANNCFAQDTILLNVVQKPLITTNQASICPTTNTTLIATGATSFTWFPGNVVANIYNINPTSSTTYTVIGTNLGCNSSNTVYVIVYPLPNAIISATNLICTGQNFILNGSGGTSYSWSGPNGFYSAIQNPSVINVSSGCAGTYSLQIFDANQCQASKVHQLTVYPNPTLNVTANTFICKGQTTTITVSGAVTYTWSDGNIGNYVAILPQTNTTYSITGFDSNGCYSGKSVTIKVSDCLYIQNTLMDQDQYYFYPNPVIDKITFAVNKSAKIKIYSIGGIELLGFDISEDQNTCDLSVLSSGIYCFSLEMAGGILHFGRISIIK